jgi:hypothetical protein
VRYLSHWSKREEKRSEEKRSEEKRREERVAVYR